MSQPGSADAALPGASPAPRGTVPARAPRNWRVASRLIVLVTIPTVLGLALTGLGVSNAARSAAVYRQVGRLAVLGRQVAGLAQAMEDERSGTAAFIADGRPAAGLPALRRLYAVTDGRAAGVRRLIRHPGPEYPAQTRAGTATVLATIARLSGLRGPAAQDQAPALAVINGYSAAIAGLFPVSDDIADLSGNSVLIASVRALGSLSGMMDQAAQQQAILSVALARGRFGPGELGALTTAQAQQAGDLASFRSSATPEESRALSGTLAGSPARQAQAVEQRALAAGDGTLDLGAIVGRQWWTGMSYTVGWMGHAEQQLGEWITAYAQAQRRSAERSAIITGGAGLAALALVALVILLMARSMVRPLRRPAGAEVDRVRPDEARLQAAAGAVSAGFLLRSHALLDRLLGVIDSLELSEDDPERLAGLFQLDHLATRMRRTSDSALTLAGHDISRHATEPFPLVDLLRAAVSEIEQYDRVVLDVRQSASVSGSAAADTVHLLAELLENATTFSPRWTQVVLSGYAAGGGSLISIADDGTGMPEERLGQLNWQLAHPPLAGEANEGQVGLFAVAHLAARHGITVTLARAPAGGTAAEVCLPAALISPAALTPPEPAAEPETVTPEAAALALSAPVPCAEPAEAEAGGALPIFEAVESGYLHAFGRDLPGPGDPDAGLPAAGGPAGGPAAAGLPQRIPQASHARTAAGQATPAAMAADVAERTRGSLASFQRGSRRARADVSAKQPGHDG